MTALPSIGWTTLTVDCSDAEELGAFYSRLFSWDITARDGSGWLQLRNPEGGISLNIQAEDTYEAPVWPDRSGHQAKMMHFEVLVDDLDAAVQLVHELGGNEARVQPADRDRSRLRIMLPIAVRPTTAERQPTSHQTKEREEKPDHYNTSTYCFRPEGSSTTNAASSA